jgi:ubiquinone biosynthesis protein UbiJ
MLLATAERLLNRWIAESTPARRQLRDVEGKSLAVECRGLPLRVVLVADDGRLTIREDSTCATDAVIRASPFDLAELAGPNARERFKKTRAELGGEVRIAEAFADLLARARPDLEAELARLVGGVAAHEAGVLARAMEAWGRRAGSVIEANVADYVHDEADAAPRRRELESFYTAGENLRDDLERCEQRLERAIARASQAPE